MLFVFDRGVQNHGGRIAAGGAIPAVDRHCIGTCAGGADRLNHRFLSCQAGYGTGKFHIVRVDQFHGRL